GPKAFSCSRPLLRVSAESGAGCSTFVSATRLLCRPAGVGRRMTYWRNGVVGNVVILEQATPAWPVRGRPEAVWCDPEVFGIANIGRSVEQLDNKIPVISVNTSRKIRKPEHSQLNQAASSPVV
ncbi:hypothetical protein, partial [Streptomyces europaeiscabiei]|uniref:hypothetical protein n=1 Tax=Streptomyces europaeiscabiei TaxID=146819 RepID=UPI0029B560DA